MRWGKDHKHNGGWDYADGPVSVAMLGPARGGWCQDMLPIMPPDPSAPTDQAKAALAVDKARAGTP